MANLTHPVEPTPPVFIFIPVRRPSAAMTTNRGNSFHFTHKHLRSVLNAVTWPGRRFADGLDARCLGQGSGEVVDNVVKDRGVCGSAPSDMRLSPRWV